MISALLSLDVLSSMEFFCLFFFVSLFRSSQVETILKAESQIKYCCFQTVIFTEEPKTRLHLGQGLWFPSYYNLTMILSED